MKFLLFCLLALTVAFSVNAQHTTPRWGTSASQDNTYRNQKLGYRAVTDLAQSAIDSITLTPNALSSHVSLTLNDSCVLFASPANAFYGDELFISISNTAGSGHIVRFSGRGAVATPFQFGSGGASMTLTASKRANIRLKFDGSAWVEVSRMVQ